MAETLVAADFDLPTNVSLNLAAEVTFDGVLGLDSVTKLSNLIVGQSVGTQVRRDFCLLKKLLSTGWSNAIDVSESDFHALVAREVNSCKACHMAKSFRLSRWFSPHSSLTIGQWCSVGAE